MACGKLPSQDNKISKERWKDINISGIFLKWLILSDSQASKHDVDNIWTFFIALNRIQTLDFHCSELAGNYEKKIVWIKKPLCLSHEDR